MNIKSLQTSNSINLYYRTAGRGALSVAKNDQSHIELRISIYRLYVNPDTKWNISLIHLT